MIPIDEFLAGLHKSIDLFKPETALIITFVMAIIADLVFKKVRNIAGYVALAGLGVTGYFMAAQCCCTSASTFSDLLVVDPFAKFFKVIILISSIVVILMTFFSKEMHKDGRSVGEFYMLLLGMAIGMFLLAGANNLLMIYLAVELMSLSSYVLAGYTKEVQRSSEASLKYVIFGSLSSGVMIYGMSILFGLTGSLNLFEIHTFFVTFDGSIVPVLVSGLMVLAGIAYKISAVPFHFWTPDVYEGAPIPVTAYLSVASKAAGFAVLIRFFKIAYIDPNSIGGSSWELLGTIDWQFIIAVVAVLTMTLGNLVAVWQTNVKRILAYSSIAHAGYMLMGVTVMNDAGIMAILLYFFMYMVMNLGAFYVVMLIHNKLDSEELEDYVGLGYKAPMLCGLMTIFMISLTGLPPTAGFIGKLFLFEAVVDSGMMWLALIGILNSVVSLYYYVKVIRNMWVRGVDNENKSLEFSFPSQALAYVLAFATLWFFVAFSPILTWAKESITIFMK